ncbi:hypothetical protein BGW37DRAFT_436102 [Umbelopsis sp. PMI_123]|nr:hypothetical protein BGW37DRAFT_436102 [Umbelopsis sp. PMI_123]
MKFLSLVTLSGILVASVVNAATNATSLSGKTINVTADSLCIFMPKTPRELIAASEHDAIAFCNNTAAAPGAKEIPKGFIKSAHFVNGTGQGNYVQYTGSIDVSKYSLNSTDGGGQYDNHGNGKPVGASCEGYAYFVELIEPDVKRYCVRCCQVYEDCNAGRSTYGCARVVPGDFS